MSRYAGYPRWMLLVKAGVFAVFLPTIIYLELCNFASMHYQEKFERYDDAGLDISAGWSEGEFDEYHVCLSGRYLAAETAAISYPPFDLLWMVRNWNRDFLADQPPCSAKEPK